MPSHVLSAAGLISLISTQQSSASLACDKFKVFIVVNMVQNSPCDQQVSSDRTEATVNAPGMVRHRSEKKGKTNENVEMSKISFKLTRIYLILNKPL